MKRTAFTYHLPDERIALRPVRPRSRSRLLVVDRAGFSDRMMSDLPEILLPGDRLVFNDTKVIPAQLNATRDSRNSCGPKVPISLTLDREFPDGSWRAVAKPLKRLRHGDLLRIGPDLEARVLAVGEGECRLQFNVEQQPFEEALQAHGQVPLPRYISSRRPADEQDKADYQTVFASYPGAVAAPTAALHFDNRLVADLKASGIRCSQVTLHVGLGTFLPMRSEDIEEHQMHAEWGCISEQAAQEVNETRQAGGRIIAVGTTALRLLESAASDGEVSAWSGDTCLFIRPEYRFRAVDGLITNFHAPESTLLVLVAAFMGLDRTCRFYEHALESGYRFLSYGDGSLLLPRG